MLKWKWIASLLVRRIGNRLEKGNFFQDAMQQDIFLGHMRHMRNWDRKLELMPLKEGTCDSHCLHQGNSKLEITLVWLFWRTYRKHPHKRKKLDLKYAIIGNHKWRVNYLCPYVLYHPHSVLFSQICWSPKQLLKHRMNLSEEKRKDQICSCSHCDFSGSG